MNEADQPVIIEPQKPATATVIWLHGLGADGNDFVPAVPALELPPGHGIRFLFPHAPVQAVSINNGMRMRAWYDIRDMNLTLAEDADGITASQRFLEDLIAQQVAAGIDRQRIVLAGFSQGGAIALHTGLRQQRPVAGIVALSTYLPLADRWLDERQAASRAVPIFMAHGEYDPIIPLTTAEHSARALQDAGYPLEWRHYPMEHSVNNNELKAIGRWLSDRLE